MKYPNAYNKTLLSLSIPGALSAPPLQAADTTGRDAQSGFALGAVFLPTWVFSLGVAHFGEQIRHHLTHYRSALENTRVALPVVTGTATAMGWIRP